MQYWLVKSEPDAFSWDQQVANGVEPWTGVRNHTAKQNLKAMKTGRSGVLLPFQSGQGRSSAWWRWCARPTRIRPPKSGDWVCVDMKAVAPMPKPVTLVAIKADPTFADFALVRQSRLSVVPVSKPHWDRICRMGGWKE